MPANLLDSKIFCFVFCQYIYFYIVICESFLDRVCADKIFCAYVNSYLTFILIFIILFLYCYCNNLLNFRILSAIINGHFEFVKINCKLNTLFAYTEDKYIVCAY